MLAVTQHAQPVRQAGLTLLELLIVLAVVAVLAVMAVPSIIDRWQRETVILLAERLASTISLAQSTAQHRHVQTQVGPRNNSTSWADGWELTALSDKAPGAASFSARETLVSVALPTVPAVRLSVPASLPRATLSYEAVGYSRMTEMNGVTVTISSGRHTRLVRINAVGRPRICDPDTDRSGNCTTSDNDP